MTVGGAEKSQQCHKYFLQYSTIASERLETWFEHRGTKIAFCPESHLASLRPMGVVGLITNHKPTLPSHKSLMGVNFRQDMLHENEKFYSFTLLPN